MRRRVAIAAMLVTVAAAACGSSGLTEDESAWCRDLGRDELIEAGDDLGIDLRPVFEEGQRIFDEAVEEGDFEAAIDEAIAFTEDDGRFVEVCKAANAER